jgi:hypothetical protein
VGLGLVLLLALGCGDPLVGFVNRTPQSTAFLWEQWQAAQNEIAHNSTALNLSEPSTPTCFIPPDPQALTMEPHGLLVESVPDDGMGEIMCPPGCDVGLTAAYSIPGQGVFYAASLNSEATQLGYALKWEFENQILFSLGYDVKYR